MLSCRRDSEAPRGAAIGGVPRERGFSRDEIETLVAAGVLVEERRRSGERSASGRGRLDLIEAPLDLPSHGGELQLHSRETLLHFPYVVVGQSLPIQHALHHRLEHFETGLDHRRAS